MSRLVEHFHLAQQTYNMLGANYKYREVKPLIILGVDTLEFGLDIGNYNKKIRPYLRTFKILKEEGQIQGNVFELEINGINFSIELSGMRFYAYRLTCKDFTIGFAEKVLDENPEVRVRLMAGFLWSYGYRKAYEKFIEWFSYFGANVIKTRISRLDICVDTDKVYFTASDAEGFVTRAKNKVKHYVNDEFNEGRKFSGFTIGRGNPLLARIYEKTLEVKKSGKVWFYEIWKENGWDMVTPIWRTEFQLRRKVLKELKIDKVEELFNKENELWAYLTGEWLVLRKKNSNNVSRWKEKRKWMLIRKAKINEDVSPLIREKIKQGNIIGLLNQANGLLISIAANASFENVDQALKLLKKWGNTKLAKDGLSFTEKVLTRRKKFLK
ncbi:MAG: replication initiation factor [Bacillota bacterium]|nr:replication initiation factor [Bacillota bacterium]